ncbi:MAG: hypothetical protein H0X27_09835, partial [Caulobacteraceae bacterium]|nr:hypothetical protein [Caulobacteraceae bacterium]
LSVLARARRGEAWLWPALPSIGDLEAEAPRALKLPGERHDWAKARLNEAVAARVAALQARLDAARAYDVIFRDGELSLFADGAAVLDRIYLEEADGALAGAYWRWLLLTGAPGDAARFAGELRRVPIGAGTPAATQFIAKVADLAATVVAIEAAEKAINARLFELYGLSDQERFLVENRNGHRRGAANHP